MNDTIDMINEQACAWIAKMHDADLTPAEATELQQWMRQSPAHKAELKRMASRWDELNVLTELAVPLKSPVTKSPTKKSSVKKSVAAPVPVFAFALKAWGVAASVMLLAFTLWFIQPPSNPQASLAYATVIGEQRLVTLSDQTTVLLNTNSAIQVNYSVNTRTIKLLQGEAHFDVTSNPQRPFRVKAGKGVVNAIGTAFSVRLREEAVDVIVTEGRVEFNRQSLAAIGLSRESAIIDAGQSAVLNEVVDTIEMVQNTSDPWLNKKLSWRNGLLKFSGDPLEDVVAEISRYTELNIVILDPQLRSLRVGGLFKVGETHKMFEVLEKGFGVHAQHINDKTVHLTAIKKTKASE